LVLEKRHTVMHGQKNIKFSVLLYET